MMRRTATELQEVHAMNCGTVEMTPADRDQWYKDHPVSDYEEALEHFSDDDPRWWCAP